jgi:predicted MFS family arabinose efflux permease
MAIYQGVFLFAVGVGPMPGGFLAERYGFRAPFAACAIAGLVAAMLAWTLVAETRPERTPRLPGEPSPVPAFGSQLRILTRQMGFMLISLVGFMNSVVRTGALFSLIPMLARDRLSLRADRVGLGLTLASLVGLVVVYPSGILLDWYGRKAVIVPAVLLSGVSLLLFVLAPSYPWFLAGCVVWSVATGVSGAAPAAYAADVAPEGMNAAAMSGYRMLADLGYVIGPLSLGLSSDLVGADTTLGVTAGLMAITALLFARYAPESLERRESSR